MSLQCLLNRAPVLEVPLLPPERLQLVEDLPGADDDVALDAAEGDGVGVGADLLVGVDLEGHVGDVSQHVLLEM